MPSRCRWVGGETGQVSSEGSVGPRERRGEAHQDLRKMLGWLMTDHESQRALGRAAGAEEGSKF